MNSRDESPLISIIVPVFNQEHYVEESLNSILNQSYSNLEVIIIDNESEDRSVECIEQWLIKAHNKRKNGHHFSFIKIKRSSSSETINQGLSIAKGNYFTILPIGDFYHQHRIEIIMNRIKEENGEWAFTAIKLVDHNGHLLPVGDPCRNNYEFLLHQLVIMPTVGFQLLFGNLIKSVGNLLFSQNIYKTIGNFKNSPIAEYDFAIRTLLQSEPIFLSDDLYFYRLNAQRYEYNSTTINLEIKNIHQHYLLETSFSAPKNLQAPCHWYWPLAFSLIRSKLKMDQGLNVYLTRHPIGNLEECHDQNYPSLNKSSIQRMKKKKKISLITHELTLTGAPKVVVDLAKSLKEKGYTVKVISLFEGPMRKELESQQIPIYVLPKKIAGAMLHSPKGYKRYCCRLLASFILLFKLHKITIGNTCVTGPLMVFLSLLNPFYRLIWYIHDSSPPSAVLGMEKMMVFLLNLSKRNRRFERWFGSKNTQNIWENSELGGKTVYWSGIPACHQPKSTSKKPLKEILSVGTSCPRKGTHYLIEAFMMGIKEGFFDDHTHLTIIGFYDDINAPHDYVGDLIIRVVHSGFKDRISLVPNLQPHLLEHYYQKADLYVQSSTQECLPLALLQAMSSGIPIITTDVNGCSEAIEDEKTGYVCRPRNSRILLNTILKAINNPEKSREMGQEAQKVFNEKFSLDKNIEEVLKQLA